MKRIPRTGESRERKTGDRLARFDRLFEGNSRVFLAVVMAGVVFPVFVMIFATGLDMALTLLTLPFGGLRRGMGESLSTLNLAVAVVFSLAACRYLWKNADRPDRPER